MTYLASPLVVLFVSRRAVLLYLIQRSTNTRREGPTATMHTTSDNSRNKANHTNFYKRLIGNENSARSFSDRSFSEPPWGHGRPRLRVMDVRTEMLVFQDFEGLTEVFAPGRPPGYPRGRPPDIRPQNLLFGLIFRS